MSLVDLGKRLLEAAKRGDTDEVRQLMSNGAPFTTDWLGTSPLHFSAQFGHLSTAEVLLRAGISRDARTKVDRTPLHVAAQEGHVDIVDLLLQHAADIDAKDMLKMTPLHWATEKGHLGVIETLLKGQADVHCENKFERTPLDIAIINGRPDIVQTLQLAQHTAVGNLQEPTETVTVETSEVDGQDTIIDGSGGIPMDGHTVVTDAESGNIILNMRQIKTEPGTFDIKGESADESAEEEGNSTSVLATLAALAEATAQNTATSSNSTDAINWLESQGITMISTADGNIITSAVESGQTISLTEAGKIALNIIKQQGLATEDGVLSDVVEEDKDGTQKVITYVTADGRDLHQDTTGLHISSVTSVNPDEVAAGDIVINQLTQLEGGEEEDEEDGPDRKRARLTDEETTESTEIDVDSMLQKTGAGDVTTIDSSDVEEMEREKLRKELEDIKRQAEEFKEQLKQKDRDLEEYKKQLGEISDKSDDLKTS